MKKASISAICSLVLVCGCQTGQPLFNGQDLAGWVEVGSTGSWSVADGVLKCSGQKDGYAWLSTDGKYGDFELTVEWRIPVNGNTGLFLRAPDREGRTSMKGFEVQTKDDRADKDLTDATGAVFSRIPAGGRFSLPPGEWNRYKISCVGRRLRIELNGHLVSDTDMDTIESMKTVPNEGHIGLQNHGDAVEFRNIRVQPLE